VGHLHARKIAEEALRSRREILQSLADLEELTSHLSSARIVSSALQFVQARTGIPHLSVTLVSPDGKAFQLADAVGTPTSELERDRSVPITSAVLSDVVDNRLPRYRPDIAKETTDPEYDRRLREPGVNCDFLVPLLAGETCIGTLNTASPEIDGIARDTRELLTLLAPRLAGALQNSRLYEALHESEVRFRQLFNEAPAGYHELDESGSVTRVNHTELDMLGYTADEMLGRPIWSFIVEEDDAREVIQGKLAGDLPPGQAFERIFRRKDGSTIPVLIENRLLHNEDGRIIGIRSTMQDITKRKQAEHQIRHLNLELEQRVRERTAELTASNEELEAFCHSVSHDLRAPLRAIDGFSQAICEDYAELLDPQGQATLQRIRRASQRMARLIDDLLNLSRMARSQMSHERVDLSEIARSVAAEYQAAEPDREVSLAITDGLTACGDAQLVRIAMANLIGNAWKFTGKRRDAQIQFDCVSRGGAEVYVVRDNGVGFDMAYANRLFLAFQRLHGTADFEGTGIGLATVQRIIQRHGGRIWAEAEPGRGASFYFTLSPERPHDA